MLGCLGFQEHLVHLKIQVVRQQVAEKLTGSGFKTELAGATRLKVFRGARSAEVGLELLDAAHRQERPNFGLLGQRVDVVGENHVDCVDLTTEEQLLSKFGNGPRLSELR